MKQETLNSILEILDANVWSKSLVKLRISGPRKTSLLYSDITIILIDLAAGTKLQFLYKYPDKVITKNYDLEESKTLISKALTKFKNLSIITAEHTYQYNAGRNKLYKTANKKKLQARTEHNKKKEHHISQDKQFLKELGITNASGNIAAGKGAKFKQINRFIDIFQSLVTEAELGQSFEIVDMGSGKGYLTFAMCDYLSNKKGFQVKVEGVELRKDLVEKCNAIAKKCDYKSLCFVHNDIQSTFLEKTDVLIALHACDTATDDAIAKGIEAKAKLIVCSPCCHKQIRKQLSKNIRLKALTKFGILEERQAELITDVLRTLILELHGYKTKVLEFVSSEHTAKNLMIVAVHSAKVPDVETITREIQLIKSEFGIDFHYLEKATKLNISNS